MHLTEQEKQILDGKWGEAARIAMSILTELGESIGAKEMIQISLVHTDSGFYLGDAGLDFVEHLAGLKAKVAVPTSLNNTSYDLKRGHEYGITAELIEKIKRLEKAHIKMGVTPTWTCAPYQGGLLPKFGDAIAWSESNAIVFANSIIGARTNRTGDLIDICVAITGRYPKSGLYLTENRKAELLVRLTNITNEMLADTSIYPLIGYLIGELAGSRVAAIDGIPQNIDIDSLKGLGAAAASSGPVALFHIVGVTPEAQTLDMCLKGKSPEEVIDIDVEMIKNAEKRLWTTKEEKVDWIALGCPHFSYMEFMKLASLVEGKKIHKDVAATVFTNRTVYAWLNGSGILKILKEAGIEVYTDGCLLLYPQKKGHISVMMTNSAKAANYIYSQAGLDAAYGSLEDCVESAIAGNIRRRSSQWLR